MYQFKSEESLNPFSSESIQIKHIPEFSNKLYSFNDPMFQSFGHNQKILDLKKYPNAKVSKKSRIQEQHKKQAKFHINSLAQKISHIDTMLKIPKNILHPCVLAINSQNKQKTEIIIQLNRNNEDPKIKNICSNAGKYLKFLNFFEQNVEILLKQPKKIQVIYQQESRNQLKTQDLSNNSIISQKSRRRPKFEHVQIINQRNQTQNTFSRFYNQKTQKQFTTNSNSKYFSNKNPQILDESIYSAQRMFNKIQTPKIFSNKIYIERSSSETQLTSFHKLIPKYKIQGKQEDRSLKKKSLSKTPKSLSKYKQKQLNLIKLEKKEKSPIIQKDFQKYSKFEKPNKINIAKNKDNKTKVVKVDIFAEKEKSLALKTVDQTNQFQKMLKMTSSRIN